MSHLASISPWILAVILCGLALLLYFFLAKGQWADISVYTGNSGKIKLGDVSVTIRIGTVARTRPGQVSIPISFEVVVFIRPGIRETFSGGLPLNFRDNPGDGSQPFLMKELRDQGQWLLGSYCPYKKLLSVWLEKRATEPASALATV